TWSMENSENRKCGRPALPARPTAESRGAGMLPSRYFSGDRAPLAALRARTAALLRRRSIWPRGRVTQISPIHSSLTPTIGLALKLVRLTTVDDLPRSIVFR